MKELESIKFTEIARRELGGMKYVIALGPDNKYVAYLNSIKITVPPVGETGPSYFARKDFLEIMKNVTPSFDCDFLNLGTYEIPIISERSKIGADVSAREVIINYRRLMLDMR